MAPRRRRRAALRWQGSMHDGCHLLLLRLDRAPLRCHDVYLRFKQLRPASINQLLWDGFLCHERAPATRPPAGRAAKPTSGHWEQQPLLAARAVEAVAAHSRGQRTMPAGTEGSAAQRRRSANVSITACLHSLNITQSGSENG